MARIVLPRDAVDDLILNYDPASPQARFVKARPELAATLESARLPTAALPWPKDLAPKPAPPARPPAKTDDLSTFAGYDAVIVTWTAAEATTLAALLSPGANSQLADWYEYQHDIASYEKLVTGAVAPFNDKTPDMARYYHSLGLYYPCRIGQKRVLLFKSGLHLDYDGPAVPVRKLMAEIANAVKPNVFITTGTGGGIGKDVQLGDVVIAHHTVFDCQDQFKGAAWLPASPPQTSPLPAKALSLMTEDLLRVNAARLPTAWVKRPVKMWHGTGTAIATTDFFGFDDSTDYYGLQQTKAQASDMGDAMVGLAMTTDVHVPGLQWFAIRNASDPQMPVTPGGDIVSKLKAAKTEAGTIYQDYGAFTTAGSVIASWAVVAAS